MGIRQLYAILNRYFTEEPGKIIIIGEAIAYKQDLSIGFTLREAEPGKQA
jgi:hypothetical protein